MTGGREAGRAPTGLRLYLLREIKAASLRAELAACDLKAIGIALRENMITPAEAMAELAERDGFSGLMRYIDPTPPDTPTPEQRAAEDQERRAAERAARHEQRMEKTDATVPASREAGEGVCDGGDARRARPVGSG